ncbi:hypothetical protein [Hyphomicrobium sp.]|uniref:hypothetical protein n=1 Tax=Hyphomicrobium sp. TaxID=82 RepID=UPI0025C5EFE4|nr:hypothetical protein [Hyphomicrobium sp.]MCC7252271.1 hypothetical protein [Hyphomicrobium sp.]
MNVRHAAASAANLALVAGLLGLSGCLGACAIGTGPEIGARAGLGCVDDSPECINRRQATLRHMVDDKSKSWINESPTPEAYASGVRLFAYKTKKKELTCAELRRGKLEADTARTSLASMGSRLTPAQVSRSTMLAGEVGRELQNEINRRCKTG